MAFQLGDDDKQELSEINMIPLIDIMLVLMIVFLVTATVLNPTVPLELPDTSATINQLPPKVIQISIDKQTNIYIDQEKISLTNLKKRFTAEVKKAEPPAVQLSVDKNTRYDSVAQVLAIANETGLTKIAFVNE